MSRQDWISDAISVATGILIALYLRATQRIRDTAILQAAGIPALVFLLPGSREIAEHTLHIPERELVHVLNVGNGPALNVWAEVPIEVSDTGNPTMETLSSFHI